MDLFRDVFEYGIYYYPAWKHYGNRDIEIGCDRCQRLGLYVCIGWNDCDICMECMADLEEYFEKED